MEKAFERNVQAQALCFSSNYKQATNDKDEGLRIH